MFRLYRVLPAMLIAMLCVGPVRAATPVSTSQTIAQNAASTLSGVASDNYGKPLPGVAVTLDGPAHKAVTTDAGGTYSFADLPAGFYSISASKAGFATQRQDLAIAAGTATKIDVAMLPASLQSLRTIGTVSTSASRSGFNASGLSVTTLDGQKIVARVQPNLKDIVSELPGVVSSRDSGGRTPNSSFMVRGSQLETKVNIDGHGVSSGVFGTYNTNYANSQIFQQVEVLKGAGLNGPNAGESAIGTINLRTRDFVSKNEWSASIAADGYGSGYYQGYLNHNFNDKFSILAVRSYEGYRGPDQGVAGYTISGAGASGTVGYAGPAAIQWQSELSDPYATLADLVKARYKFSQSTSLTAEFLNLTGRYFNQGGSYAINYGQFPIAQCFNNSPSGGSFGSGAACTPGSTFTAPSLFGLVGTKQTLYSYFPQSFVLNQEPQFSAELRTTLRGDTLLLRPYRAEIKRFIDGSREDLTPGYGFARAPNGWYQVTDPANCQVQFMPPGSPGVASGARGPCFVARDNYATPYVGTVSGQPPTAFGTSSTAPACSMATPCYTTPTNAQRNGVYAFNTPFSQPEIDRTSGVTFSYIHPVKENLYSFNVDYNSDNTLKFSGDTSPLPAGCFATVSAVANTPTVTIGGVVKPNPYYQPSCQVNGAPFAVTPRNSLQIPPTTNYRTDYSLTALLQVNPRLQIGIGNYLTVQRMDYKYTDPAAAAAAATFGLNGAEQADATLLNGTVSHTHYDPHVQAEYRLSNDISLRASGGSSVTVPYAGVVSGFTSLSVNSGPDGKSDTLFIKNPALRPESTVAYDGGFDARLRDGTIISGDVFSNTIHDVFISYSQLVANLPGRMPSQTIQNTTVNGPLERNYGFELTAQKTPLVGWGYYATATAQRSFYDGFSNAFYQGLAAFAAPGKPPGFVGIVNGKQLDSSTSFTGQVPYFKAKVEANFAFPNRRAFAAFGTVINGNNNPYGGSGFNTFYANGRYDLSKDFTLGLAGENIFNYTNGATTGNVVYGTGFTPIGVRWNPYLPGGAGLEYGAAFGGSNNVVIVKPANFYLTLTKHI